MVSPDAAAHEVPKQFRLGALPGDLFQHAGLEGAVFASLKASALGNVEKRPRDLLPGQVIEGAACEAARAIGRLALGDGTGSFSIRHWRCATVRLGNRRGCASALC